MGTWDRIRREPNNFWNFCKLVVSMGKRNPMTTTVVIILYSTSILSLLNLNFFNSFLAGSLATLISIHVVIYEYNQLYIRALNLSLDRLESIKHINETTKYTYNQTVSDVTQILESKR